MAAGSILDFPWRADAFWSKVELGDGCWKWLDRPNSAGYGTLHLGRGGSRRAPINTMAHRASWELKHRDRIPSGMEIDHRCKNRLCVNPDHLAVCTRAENLSGVECWNSKKTHCPKGHPYDVVHTWFDRQRGKTRVARRCHRCKAEVDRLSHARGG